MAETRQMSLADKLTQRVARAEEVRANAGTDELDAFAEAGTKDKVLENILPGQHLAQIRVELISPAPEGQARSEFDEGRLRALAESLKRSGLREPIIVTPHGAAPGRYQLVAGERRWRAAQLAGLAELPCIVDPKLVDRRDKLLAQAEENLHRENLNPVEEARVLVQLMESRELDVQAAGELIGRSDIQARRLYRIHSTIEPIKHAVLRGDLDARAAIEVDRIYNTFPKADVDARAEAVHRIEKLIARIVEEKWSIRRLEQYGNKGRAPTSTRPDGDCPETPKPEKLDGDTHASTVGGEERTQAAPAVPQLPSPIVVREGGRLVIDEHRIERRDVTPEEREQLIEVLEGLLMRVRRC